MGPFTSRSQVGRFTVGVGSIAGLLALLWASGAPLAGDSVSRGGPQPVRQDGGYQLKLPFGLEESAVVIPDDNPLTSEKIELGRQLFFDKRMSTTNKIACASCHLPNLAFTDGQRVSSGIKGLKGNRSAPTSLNRVFSKGQFWDGRAETLEAQSIGPFTNPVEHGFADYDQMLVKLKKIKGYQTAFRNVFDSDITMENVGKAIASFQRTMLSGNSPADRFDMGGEENAISPEAQKGLELFRGKARCVRCHSGFNFTDEKFHNLGIGWDDNTVDLGRYMVSKNPEEIGAFKTPTLREISRTAPYMHDGRFATLEAVVDFYNQGGIANPHLDNNVIALELTPEEKKALVAFLHTLNGEGWQKIAAPKTFPQ
ncbi:Cytochrome c551 peroxidase [Nitrospira sp. KM1]|uniref:cytochrome-c peroxidase n=1 Tax=Nitrospira sp. KM1 TaxID=1936990 RepID=UPI0013A73CB5|nr:cytochrome c peroxidase [Nitrospira sp. KM1]BCA54603.1 Cytochrome c551 peroxidase [Nitrospira sp. KM1]